MNGYIHSIESFGTVDGPGLRYVVFFQGCPMRCRYCHNPDTWQPEKGDVMSAEEVMAGFRRNKSFYAKGGITVTGGEPLLQIDFLTELFRLAKAEGVHTCLDTSGITYNRGNAPYMEKLDRLMEYTDLIMLDIKHIDDEQHKKLTAHSNKNILEFVQYLDKKSIPVWVRHVVVPGVTDDPVYWQQLGRFMATVKNIKALDVLPYHTMGVKKYEELGIEYPLKDTPARDKELAVAARNTIIAAMKKARAEMI
ncbi:MAG: pyruvate formate lyase-activating protein [Oscillospiraceae bacterium]|nr:pyruvate formate lyase-activating protein [Oscillospiraceae bacterium]